MVVEDMVLMLRIEFRLWCCAMDLVRSCRFVGGSQEAVFLSGVACSGTYMSSSSFIFGFSLVFTFDFLQFVLHDRLEAFVSSGKEEYIVSLDSGPPSMSSKCFQVSRDTLYVTVRSLGLGTGIQWNTNQFEPRRVQSMSQCIAALHWLLG